MQPESLQEHLTNVHTCFSRRC